MGECVTGRADEVSFRPLYKLLFHLDTSLQLSTFCEIYDSDWVTAMMIKRIVAAEFPSSLWLRWVRGPKRHDRPTAKKNPI